MIEAEEHRVYKADLRVFGAIGFQNAPNGLWLRKQGYDKDTLPDRIVSSALIGGVNIIGLTSEDDLMNPGSPEDRFGFFKKLRGHVGRGFKMQEKMPFITPIRYTMQETEQGVLRLDMIHLAAEETEGPVYIVNAETRHANRELGQDWSGLKVHIVGGNCLRKDLNLEDTIKDANDRGYTTFLIVNLSTQESYDLAAKAVIECTGVIGHDANNIFPGWMNKIPRIGRALSQHSHHKNKLSTELAGYFNKPSIAVSSAHWMHEIGRASIQFTTPEAEFTLADLRRAIESKDFKTNKGHNRIIDVLKFGKMLREYGGSPDRFAGDPESSYSQGH